MSCILTATITALIAGPAGALAVGITAGRRRKDLEDQLAAVSQLAEQRLDKVCAELTDAIAGRDWAVACEVEHRMRRHELEAELAGVKATCERDHSLSHDALTRALKRTERAPAAGPAPAALPVQSTRLWPVTDADRREHRPGTAMPAQHTGEES